MIVIDSISCLSARMSAIIHSNILHTSFRMVCWPPYCPMYYTCEYYNTYVYFCPYIENFPLYLLMKIGSKGRRPARRRVGSGASPAAELPLWSILRKFPQSVDTERGNGYNTYRVRPKRSANNSWLFHLEDNRPDYGRAVIFCVSLLLWTWFRLKKQKEARITSTCATPPFGECADRRLPLVLYL